MQFTRIAIQIGHLAYRLGEISIWGVQYGPRPFSTTSGRLLGNSEEFLRVCWGCKGLKGWLYRRHTCAPCATDEPTKPLAIYSITAFVICSELFLSILSAFNLKLRLSLSGITQQKSCKLEQLFDKTRHKSLTGYDRNRVDTPLFCGIVRVVRKAHT